MKFFNITVPPLVLMIAGLGWCGCQTEKGITRLAGGFEEVAHPSHKLLVGEEETIRVSFQYRGADDKVVKIWSALTGAKEVIRDDLAIFVGDRAYLQPEAAMRARLFAVRPPEPPLDITDEVLWRWSQTTGKNFGTALERFNLVIPEEKNGKLELHLEFSSDTYMTVDKDWPDQGNLQLNWNQVAEMMRAVKTKGILQKDLRWKTPFIGERF